MEFIILTRWPLSQADVWYLEKMIQQRWPGAAVTVSQVKEPATTGPSEFKSQAIRFEFGEWVAGGGDGT